MGCEAAHSPPKSGFFVLTAEWLRFLFFYLVLISMFRR
jgi:hypothetical protein